MAGATHSRASELMHRPETHARRNPDQHLEGYGRQEGALLSGTTHDMRPSEEDACQAERPKDSRPTRSGRNAAGFDADGPTRQDGFAAAKPRVSRALIKIETLFC